MIIQMMKSAGGNFTPAFEMDLPILEKLKNGEMYPVEVKKLRNPAFHRKVFAFLKFCFDHWAADKTDWKYFDERAQFDAFRKHLTVLAGYKKISYTIDGRMRVEAESLSFGNMDELEFQMCYDALIMAAMEHIFDRNDKQMNAKLLEFFS